jgi:hypothetical protein
MAAGIALAATSPFYVAHPVRIGGRAVTNVPAVVAQARATAEKAGFQYSGADSLRCYFSATTPASVVCGPLLASALNATYTWDIFPVIVHGASAGMTAALGPIGQGPLPVGTQLDTGGSLFAVVAANQTGYAHQVITGSKRSAIVLIVVASLWAGVGAVTGPARRRDKQARVAALAQRSHNQRAWASLAALPTAAPVPPPTSVLVASTSTAPWSGAGSSGPSPITAVPVDDRTPSSHNGETADGESETVGDRADGPQWSGPAVLLIGPVQVVGWTVEPDRKVVVELAAYLACHQDRPRSAEEIQAALWPLAGTRAEVSLDTVRQHLSRVRRALGEDHFPDATKAGGYRLEGTVSSDWFRFQALAEAARRTGDDRAVSLWRDALALVRGAPFAGAAAGTFGWAWDELLVATMEAAVGDVAHRMAERCLATDQAQWADWAVRRGLLAVPTDETLLGDRLVAALAIGGRSGLDRAWRDVKSLLGEQAENGPLGATYQRLQGPA